MIPSLNHELKNGEHSMSPEFLLKTFVTTPPCTVLDEGLSSDEDKSLIFRDVVSEVGISLGVNTILKLKACNIWQVEFKAGNAEDSSGVSNMCKL